jgi:hypothetical protein
VVHFSGAGQWHIVIVFILFGVFVVGSVYPPNNWDSMTYHMSRVIHWVNNGSVQFYPTGIERQLYQMPLAGFAVMHSLILSGSDKFANLVQWACFAVSVINVALIARELGLSGKGQLFSSLVFATIPMAILQASSTQTDLVVTSFLLAFGLFMLRLGSDFNISNCMYASLSLGLALLAKGTAWVYAPPLGLLLALPVLYPARSNVSLLVKRSSFFSLIVLLALVINSGHLYRTYELYGEPVASGAESYSNKDFSGPAIAGNIMRNIALHLGTPSNTVNVFLYRLFDRILGEQLNNPSNTWRTTTFVIPFSRHEDMAGNPLHVMLIFFAVVSSFMWMPRRNLGTKCYLVGVILAGLFYGTWLRWQPWASRLHTPIFALWSPLIIIAINDVLDRKCKYFGVIAITLIVLYSVPHIVNSEARSLISLDWWLRPRSELYFANRPGLYVSYINAIDIIKKSGIREVGLYQKHNDWEYPFWVLSKMDVNFFHLWIDNSSVKLDTRSALPLCVVATRGVQDIPEVSQYKIVYSDKHLSVLMKK